MTEREHCFLHKYYSSSVIFRLRSYNYLREPGVSMSQNVYKHPCSKHLTTIGKGTIFYRNSHKKTNKKFGTTLIFNKRLGEFRNNLYLCTTRTRQASPLDLGRLPKQERCSNVRVVFVFLYFRSSFLIRLFVYLFSLLSALSKDRLTCKCLLMDFGILLILWLF